MMALERGFYAVYMCGAVRSIFISHVYYIYIPTYIYVYIFINPGKHFAICKMMGVVWAGKKTS
jgi:hypothetical protein